MAHLSYISITGEKQGMISRGGNSEDSIGCRYHINHIDEISVLAFQHSQEKNIHHSSQHFHPLMMTKLLDKSSPLPGMAFSYRDIIWKHNIAGTEGYATWKKD